MPDTTKAGELACAGTMENSVNNNTEPSFDLKIEGYVPEGRFVRKNVEITVVKSTVANLAEALFINLQSLGYTGNVTAVSLGRAMETLLKLRVRQVSKLRPIGGYRITDFRVMSVLYPVLAQIGVYRDDQAGYEIYPAFSGDDVTEADIEEMNTITQSLSYWGLSYSMGLPKDTTIDDDSLFKLCVEDELVYGQKQTPSPVTVMTRLFFSIQALADVYGDSRVVYSSIRYLQQVFIDVTARQLRNPSSVKT